MTTFDKREEAFEQQFAHDEELRFKATARRNKLLGLWAAEKLGSAKEGDLMVWAKRVLSVQTLDEVFKSSSIALATRLVKQRAE